MDDTDRAEEGVVRLVAIVNSPLCSCGHKRYGHAFLGWIADPQFGGCSECDCASYRGEPKR